MIYPYHFVFSWTHKLLNKKRGTVSLCLNFFPPICTKAKFRKKVLFIQTNSFIIFTSPIPVLLVTGYGQVGLREDCCFSEIKRMSRLHLALETIKKNISFFTLTLVHMSYKSIIWLLKSQGHCDLIIICDTPSCPCTYICNLWNL